MSSREERKKAAEVIKNSMTSRPNSDDKNSHEDAVLLRMQAAMRDLAIPSNPGKRKARKVTRMVPKGTRDALRQTNNYVRSVYTTSDEAKRSYINVYPTISTREVGPGDRYNSDYPCHGKDTESR